MHIRFDGRTVIVTGAAHGFGRAIALAFARAARTSWACDLLADELRETARIVRDTTRTVAATCASWT